MDSLRAWTGYGNSQSFLETKAVNPASILYAAILWNLGVPGPQLSVFGRGGWTVRTGLRIEWNMG